MLFTGQFEKTLDDKRRVALPKKYRDVFGGDEVTSLYLAPGLDKSLALYDEQSFTKLTDKLLVQCESQTDARHFLRNFSSRSEQIEIDKQGRFCIPDKSMEFAGLTKEVIFVGMIDHVELWDTHKWKSYEQEKTAEFDKFAEQIWQKK